MALTRADCLIWERLADAGRIPPEPSLLEIGQANWYGDMPLYWLTGQVERRAPKLMGEFRSAADTRDLFGLASVFYRTLLDVRRTVAIDMTPPAGSAALQLDLNDPIDLGEKFHVVVNTGTVEHVFDQRRALETIHDHCAVGGLMLHAGPLAGWPDHGLFHSQPGLWLDLAKANGYGIELLAYFDRHANRVAIVSGLAQLHRHRWADGSMFYAVLRKREGVPFRVPMQGVYTTEADEQTVSDWESLR